MKFSFRAEQDNGYRLNIFISTITLFNVQKPHSSSGFYSLMYLQRKDTTRSVIRNGQFAVG